MRNFKVYSYIRGVCCCASHILLSSLGLDINSEFYVKDILQNRLGLKINIIQWLPLSTICHDTAMDYVFDAVHQKYTGCWIGFNVQLVDTIYRLWVMQITKMSKTLKTFEKFQFFMTTIWIT